MAADLYIIAAGKGSRLGANIPKALVEINSECCIDSTLRLVGHKFSRVFIVANELVRDTWEAHWNKVYNSPNRRLMMNMQMLYINSGLGDGHATLHGLIAASKFISELNKNNTKDKMSFMDQTEYLSNDVVVTWGDVYFSQPEIIDELLSRKLGDMSGMIPGLHEDNPYVTLLTDEQMHCQSADFSKFGENHPTGLHDQSIFRFDRRHLWNSLVNLHNAFWKNGRYLTPGGELSLLHTFHEMYNSGRPMFVYQTDYATESFNTQEEINQIHKNNGF
jgi:NDP-sugar pyrophosphorylase family protein